MSSLIYRWRNWGTDCQALCGNKWVAEIVLEPRKSGSKAHCLATTLAYLLREYSSAWVAEWWQPLVLYVPVQSQEAEGAFSILFHNVLSNASYTPNSAIKMLSTCPSPQLPRLELGLPCRVVRIGYCMTQGGTTLIVDIIDTHIYYNNFSADGSEVSLF